MAWFSPCCAASQDQQDVSLKHLQKVQEPQEEDDAALDSSEAARRAKEEQMMDASTSISGLSAMRRNQSETTSYELPMRYTSTSASVAVAGYSSSAEEMEGEETTYPSDSPGLDTSASLFVNRGSTSSAPDWSSSIMTSLGWGRGSVASTASTSPAETLRPNNSLYVNSGQPLRGQSERVEAANRGSVQSVCTVATNDGDWAPNPNRTSVVTWASETDSRGNNRASGQYMSRVDSCLSANDMEKHRPSPSMVANRGSEKNRPNSMVANRGSEANKSSMRSSDSDADGIMRDSSMYVHSGESDRDIRPGSMVANRGSEWAGADSTDSDGIARDSSMWVNTGSDGAALSRGSMLANRGSETNVNVGGSEGSSRVMGSMWVNAGSTNGNAPCLKIEFRKPKSAIANTMNFFSEPLGFTIAQEKSTVGGSFIGALAVHKPSLYVDSVVRDSMADALGVKEGWLVKKIGDADVSGKDLEAAMVILNAGIGMLPVETPEHRASRSN